MRGKDREKRKLKTRVTKCERDTLGGREREGWKERERGGGRDNDDRERERECVRHREIEKER